MHINTPRINDSSKDTECDGEGDGDVDADAAEVVEPVDVVVPVSECSKLAVEV